MRSPAAIGTQPVFFRPACLRRLCRLCSPRAPAEPLSLLTILVCCVRSEDAEANESIGEDTILLESMPVASFAIAVTVLASSDLACSWRRRRVSRLRLVFSVCVSAHASSFAHVSRCFLYLWCSFGCVLASCAWSAGDAHAMRVAVLVGHVFLHFSRSLRSFLYIIM